MREPEQVLRQLRRLADEFQPTIDTLVADIALLGFIENVIESATTALLVAESPTPKRAYPNIRTAFESVQQAILVATDVDYVRAGSCAWIYHMRKDRDLQGKSDDPRERNDAENRYRAHLQEMRDVLSARSDSATRAFDSARAHIESLGPRSHWCGASMAGEITRRYERLSSRLRGIAPSGSLTDINNALYGALSREAHAHWRLDIGEIRIAADGKVRFVTRVSDTERDRRTVRGAVATTTMEGVLALLCRSPPHAA